MVATPRELLASASARWRSRWGPALARRDVVHLVSCATTDITQPYHSYSYLAAALQASGHAYVVRDLGIELWNYLIAPAVIAELRRACVERAATATGERRMLYHLYADLLEDGGRFEAAWRTLQAEAGFHDLEAYLPAVRDLGLLPRLLTLLSRRSVFRTFSSASPPGSEDDRINLAGFRDEVSRPSGIEVIDLFYDHHAAELAQAEPLLVGLTIPFLSQLEHSFSLGRRLRERSVRVAVGGPIAAKFYKYIDDVGKLAVLGFGADYLATGEGETLLPALAERVARGEPVSGLDNLVELAAPRRLERIHFENVDQLPAPDYGFWDYDLYASPTRGALYSPTRGCYWNKCTFCDYGLAMEGPTSPWRTRSPERVVDDLRSASAHVRHFFFAVDVLSPSYAAQLSRALIEEELDVRWMADFRLESSFKTEAVALFARAGCRGAAFGMESADQVVIDLIKKGTKVDRLGRIVDAFVAAGVPVQLMGFTGFPGESRAQAETTFEVAGRLARRAATVAIGRFGLTPGSEVARRPEAFGIEVLYEARDDASIPWELRWRHRDPGVQPYPDDLAAALRLTRGFPFPFLGATTTLHSLLYFERNPEPPFSVPSWSFDFARDRPFRVIPFYFATRTEEGAPLVHSGLTGRVLEVSPAIDEALAAYFAGDGWPVRRRDELEPAEERFLAFLVEHSLALFLPEAARA